MNPTLKKSLIIFFVSLAIALMVYIKPILRQTAAVNFMKSVLTLWEEGDSATPLKYFKEPRLCPPISSLEAYKIKNIVFSRKKKFFSATFTINLSFGPGQKMPDNQDWIIETNKTLLGWEIVRFSLIKTETDLRE